TSPAQISGTDQLKLTTTASFNYFCKVHAHNGTVTVTPSLSFPLRPPNGHSGRPLQRFRAACRCVPAVEEPLDVGGGERAVRLRLRVDPRRRPEQPTDAPQAPFGPGARLHGGARVAGQPDQLVHHDAPAYALERRVAPRH